MVREALAQKQRRYSSRHNVKALISGQVGGNAQEVLAAAGIAMYTYNAGGSVKDAFDQFTNNTLVRS